MNAVINLDDPVGKTVGRRKAPRDAFRYGMDLQQLSVDLAKSFGLRGIPKGVYRFNSHEEADEWLMSHLTRRKRS